MGQDSSRCALDNALALGTKPMAPRRSPSGPATAIHTMPTGFSSVPPLGPATPDVATAQSVPKLLPHPERHGLDTTDADRAMLGKVFSRNARAGLVHARCRRPPPHPTSTHWPRHRGQHGRDAPARARLRGAHGLATKLQHGKHRLRQVGIASPNDVPLRPKPQKRPSSFQAVPQGILGLPPGLGRPSGPSPGLEMANTPETPLLQAVHLPTRPPTPPTTTRRCLR